MKTLSLDGKTLTLEHVWQVAHAKEGELQVGLSPKSLVQMKKSREFVFKVAKEERPIYSINTGFGSLSEKKDWTKRFDRSSIQSHSLPLHRSGRTF